jgi:hypothetical protein
MVPTLQLLMFFSRHMLCCVVDCQHVNNATTASTGEARQERWQCDERGVGSGNATKNDKKMALSGGKGVGQRGQRQQMRGDGKNNNQPNMITTTTTTAMMTGQQLRQRQMTRMTMTTTRMIMLEEMLTTHCHFALLRLAWLLQ